MNKLIILSLMVFSIYPSVIRAEVKSMSLESFKEEGGVRFWEVAVKCDDDTEQKMRRVVGQGNPWCSVSDGSTCDESKFTLSRALCGAGRPVEVAIAPSESKADQAPTSQASVDEVASNINKSLNAAPEIELSDRTPATNTDLLDPIKESRRTELMREQVQIEEQRILIEQKRLELRKAELELNKLKANQ